MRWATRSPSPTRLRFWPRLKKLKEAQKGTDVAAIKAATDEVQKAFYAVSEKLYQNAAPQGDPNATPRAPVRSRTAGTTTASSMQTSRRGQLICVSKSKGAARPPLRLVSTDPI